MKQFALFGLTLFLGGFIGAAAANHGIRPSIQAGPSVDDRSFVFQRSPSYDPIAFHFEPQPTDTTLPPYAPDVFLTIDWHASSTQVDAASFSALAALKNRSSVDRSFFVDFLSRARLYRLGRVNSTDVSHPYRGWEVIAMRASYYSRSVIKANTPTILRSPDGSQAVFLPPAIENTSTGMVYSRAMAARAFLDPYGAIPVDRTVQIGPSVGSLNDPPIPLAFRMQTGSILHGLNEFLPERFPACDPTTPCAPYADYGARVATTTKEGLVIYASENSVGTGIYSFIGPDRYAYQVIGDGMTLHRQPGIRRLVGLQASYIPFGECIGLDRADYYEPLWMNPALPSRLQPVEFSGETFLVFRRSDDDTRVRLLQGVAGGWFDRTQIADGLFPRIVFSRGLMGELVPSVERSSCGVSAE